MLYDTALALAEPGDIILGMGHYRLSRLIGRMSEEGFPDEHGQYSHAMLLTQTSPTPMVVQAVPPRCEEIALIRELDGMVYATLLHAKNLTAVDRAMLVRAGRRYKNRLYGYDRFAGFYLDSRLDTDWCAQHLYLTKSLPVCSVLVAAAYAVIDKDFGEPPDGVTPAEIDAFALGHPEFYQCEPLYRKV